MPTRITTMRLLITAVFALGLAGTTEAASASDTYTVRRGDTLGTIAQRFCGSVSAYPRLAAANRITDPDLIRVGQVLIIGCQTSRVTRVVSAPRSAQPRVVRTSGRNWSATVRDLYSRTVQYDPRVRNPQFDEIERFACGVFGRHCALYLAISYAENPGRVCNVRSGLNRNGSFDTGPSQMTSTHADEFPTYDFTDCQENIMAAKVLKDRFGFKRWTQYNNGEYRKYLPRYQRYQAEYDRERRLKAARRSLATDDD